MKNIVLCLLSGLIFIVFVFGVFFCLVVVLFCFFFAISLFQACENTSWFQLEHVSDNNRVRGCFINYLHCDTAISLVSASGMFSFIGEFCNITSYILHAYSFHLGCFEHKNN